MKKCKKMLVTLLVMIMVINICACSRSSTQVSTSSDTVLKEPTKIVFFTVAETLDEDQMKAQFKEFEESNNCEIEIVFTSSSDFKQQYTTMVASGAQIDVMGINIQDIRYLYDTGAVLPLNDYIEIDKSKFVEGALDAAIWNDNVYAIPYGAFYTSMGLYYNERLFNELGFNVPATFEEFYDLADKAREAGYYASTFQAGNMYDLPVLYMLCLGQLVGGDGVGNIENICMGKAKYTDEVNVRAMQALADLAEKVCEEVNPEIQVFHGRVVSGDQFIADKETKENISTLFAGYCTEMEGAAIAQTAHLNEVPFVVLRAISDKADDSASMDYPTFEKQAVAHSVRLVCGMMKNLAAKEA